LLVLCFAFASPACPFVSVCASSQRMGTVAVVAKNLDMYIYIFCPTFFADLFRYILTDRSISLSSYVAILYARVIVSFCVRWKSRHISVDTNSLTIHGGWLVVLKEYFFLCMLTCVSSPSNGSMHFKHTQSQRPSMRLGTTFPSSHI
jgi:hypothetical protein